MYLANIFNIERMLIFILLLAFGATTFAANDALVVTNKGKAPSSQLKIKKSKVPTYEIHKAKNGIIPKLDIGEESTIEAAAIVPSQSQVANLTLKPIEKKQSPLAIEIDLKKMKTPDATPAKKVVADNAISKIPEVKILKEIAEPTIAESHPNPKDIRDMNSADYKLLEALIYLEDHKNYELALGLLTELLNEKEKDYQTEATYHSALAAQALGINSEFYSMMMKIASENKKKEWQEAAITAMVNHIESLQISDMKALDPLVQKFEIDISNNEAYNFYRAKFYLEEGQLGQVDDALSLISEKSKFHKDALLISALYNYRRAKIDTAATELEMLLKDTIQGESIRSIAAITLARIQFQKGQYKEAFNTYAMVDKGHALWLQATIEQAWAQIMVQDYEGAAGNMFTLHTDYFKNAFTPESYVVRTVGYLNLCQFGDGMNVLTNLQRKYVPAKAKLDAYKASQKQTIKYYETVKSWLKNTDLREVDGLPRSFIVELARHPAFLKIQSQINNFEDEMEKYNKANIVLIQREKDLLKKQIDTKADIAKIQDQLSKKNSQSAVDLNVLLKSGERKLVSYKMQYQVVNKARTFIKTAREKALVRIDKDKVQLREKAALALKSRFDQVLADLNHVLEQNEVLQYEIYSGAGEHIRYQLGGGDATQKERTQLKPEDSKGMKWKFKGEIWEDEVGHFRSSLKNVCPKDDKEKMASASESK